MRHARLYKDRLSLAAPLLVVCAAASGLLAVAQTKATKTSSSDPLFDSWMTSASGGYARVVEKNGGPTVATWPSSGLPNHGGGQILPAYSDIQQIGYSNDFVYINGTGLASHTMGPWYIGLNRIFGNWPTNQNYIRRFPRHPQAAAQKKTAGLGPLGLWVNGVALFNQLDGAYYDASSGQDRQGPPGPGGNPSGIWVRNAVIVEQPTFDRSNAHQPPSGEYHYHDNPIALRFQRGDNVACDTATGTYREDTLHLHHSPILGWSYDGYPIYGPYGYSEPNSPSSSVRLMVSGFTIRDGNHGTTDLRQTGRHTLAKWAAELHSTSQALDSDHYGPDVSRFYTLGRYCEDFDYLGDLGYKMGKDFDLDRYNGRWCITPEFPQGTYAYFVTLNADGSPAYPYVIGRQYYGTPSGGQVRQLSESVTMYKNTGPASEIKVSTMRSASGVALKWTSVEGGHYRIENGGSVVAADVKSQGLTTTYTLPSSTSDSASYHVTLAVLDPYDSIGTPDEHDMRPGGRP